jgi:glycosyltransferase involved in cell wall biosynthesis
MKVFIKSHDVIFLHEYGEPSHYIGAVENCRKKGLTFTFIEYRCVRNWIRAMRQKKYKLAVKAARDCILLWAVFMFPRLLAGKTVVLGAAPMDMRILLLRRLCSFSKTIYHTSWTRWGKDYPYEYGNPVVWRGLLSVWTDFLCANVSGIAAVTEKSRSSLIECIGVGPTKVSVVYHAVDTNVFSPPGEPSQARSKNAIFVGRLVESKGIAELVNLARSVPQITFHVYGAGKLISAISDVSATLPNMCFHGFLDSKEALAEAYRGSQYVLLPSKRVAGWEELFGMSLVEAMACGCIPITTDHPGPSEILDSHFRANNMFPERKFGVSANALLRSYLANDEAVRLDEMRATAIARRFGIGRIEEIWERLIDGR